MNILFLTNCRHSAKPYLDASTRYRCYNFAEDLQTLGHRADIAHIHGFKAEYLGNYNVVSFLRPTYSRKLVKWLNTCAQMGIMAIADYDDLVFSPTHASQSPQALNNQTSINQIETRYRNNFEAMRLFDHITLSTRPLKQFATEALDLVSESSDRSGLTVLPNGLSRYWLDYNDYLGNRESKSGSSDFKRIGYLSGSKSHDRDFRSIASKLFDFLKRNKAYRLRITGDLNLDNYSVLDYGIGKKQLEVTQRIPFESLPAIIVGNSINIAPLENSDFNQCKSHIKFIESAAFGVPVVSSSVFDIKRHQIPGLQIASNADDWLACLDRAADPDYLMQTRSGLMQYARTHCSSMISTHALLSTITIALGEQPPQTNNEYTDSIACSR